MTDILQLPGWEVTGTRLDGTEYVIEATYKPIALACQKCGVVGNLYRHGTKTVSYRDSPIRGCPVLLEGTLQRYRCKECGETFLPSPEGVEADRRMTTRCVQYIQEQAVRDTFTRIAEHVGCVEGTVRNIAAERFERFNNGFKPYLPTWIGMDETKLDKRQRCIITDVGDNLPVDMLKDRDRGTVVNWLCQFKQKDAVKGLAIDMWRPYLNAARIVFPGLPVVIDKFHVVRMANKALEDARIRVQNTRDRAVRVSWKRSRTLLVKRYKNLNDEQRFNLEMWLDNEPEVAEAYWLKERFYDFYDAPNKAEAARLLDAWRSSVPASQRKGKKSFLPLLTSTRNWRDEILEYFTHPISNGYTEALNGITKVINRMGRGYSFDVIRAKVLSRNKRLRHDYVPPPPPASTMRCESCGGVFEVDGLNHGSATTLQTSVENGEIRGFICVPCRNRFHTAGISHDSPLST